MDIPLITLDEFIKIPFGAVISTVTTRQHLSTVKANELCTNDISLIDEDEDPLLTFVVKKGNINDWTIYYGRATDGPTWVKDFGDKLLDKQRILRIFPCTQEVLDLYRK